VENTYKSHTSKICRACGDVAAEETSRHDNPYVPHNLSAQCPDKKMAAEVGWPPKYFPMKKQRQSIDATANDQYGKLRTFGD
jgi:hypothetical protein